MLASSGHPVPTDQPAETIHMELSLDQTYLACERVLALLRTRGYVLERLDLVPGGPCSLWIRARPGEVGRLRARLARLCGVSLDVGTAESSC